MAEVDASPGQLCVGLEEALNMTATEFRKLALGFPEAVESAHMGHPDFRVAGKKIFATLGADESWGMVKLTPRQQAELIERDPATYRPAAGAWGHGGATVVELRGASEDAVRAALTDAWRNAAPKRLLGRLDADRTSKQAGR
jgi:hypothetical protein